jgi:hypothetical protein
VSKNHVVIARYFATIAASPAQNWGLYAKMAGVSVEIARIALSGTGKDVCLAKKWAESVAEVDASLAETVINVPSGTAAVACPAQNSA